MPDNSPVFSPAKAAVWMMGALFCMVLLLGMASSLNHEVMEDQVSLGALSAVSFLLVSSLLLGRYPGGPNLREAIGARAFHPLLLPLAVLIGVTAQAPAESLRDWVERLLPPNGSGEPAGIVLLSHSRAESVALVLVLVGLVPLAEEVFFRGAIYGALRRSQHSAPLAAVISALGFTLCHVNVRLLLPIGFVAAIFGLLRASSGSLYPSLVAHMAFNAVPVVTAMNGWTAVEAWGRAHSVVIALGLCLTLLVHYLIASRSTVARLSRSQEAKPYVTAEASGGS
jgi:membrane protease YdiL (CAAX protease family)